LVVAAALPFLVANAVGSKHLLWYARCREALLFLFLVANAAAVLGSTTVLASTSAASSEAALAWSPGVEHVSGYVGRAAFLILSTALPLGCRIRFSWLLPAHAVGFILYAALAAVRDEGCAVSLALVSVTFSLALVYCCELRSRYRVMGGAKLASGGGSLWASN
jgi:hypothetical protein